MGKKKKHYYLLDQFQEKVFLKLFLHDLENNDGNYKVYILMRKVHLYLICHDI